MTDGSCTYDQTRGALGTSRDVQRPVNHHGDLSAGSGCNAISRDPEFGYEFMEEFQDRLYFGTDIAQFPQNIPQTDYFKKLKTDRLISKEAYEKITWKNAAKLLNISV